MSKKSEITKNQDGTITIKAEVPFSELQKHRESSLKALNEKVKIDGFREGKAPENLLIAKVGEFAILEEMANNALVEIYPNLVAEHKLDVIGRPNISITKLAVDNPFEFTATVSVLPDVSLPDLKKLSTEIYKAEIDTVVTDEEIQNAIKHIRQMRAQNIIDTKKQAEAKEKGEDFLPTKLSDIKDEDLPVYNDYFVKTLGKFENIADFETKLRENMSHEKLHLEHDKRRAALADKLIESCDFISPSPLVSYEQEKMMAQMKQDIAMSGMEFSDYLKAIGKTEEQMYDEGKPIAEKRAKLQLIINKIAENEKLTPSDEEMQKEVDLIMDRYGKEASLSAVSAYVAQMMTNEKVFEYLINLGGGEVHKH